MRDKARFCAPLALVVLLITTQAASAAATGLSIIQKADLNHDGNLDVVGLVNETPSNVTALLGNGKGEFGTPIVTTITGNIIDINTRSVVVADFNNDGFPDVAFTGIDSVIGSFAIGVMLGNGDGTFKAPIETTLPGSSGGQLISGNFTGSADMDLALAGSGNTVVLPGQGNGKFGTPISTSSNLFSNCAATGDFNGDGKLDIATGSAVLFGNGNGTFQSPSNFANGGCAIAVADMNKDGKPDLITSSQNGNFGKVVVHLNDGTGHFGDGTGYTVIKYSDNALAVADFNGDGAPDVAALDTLPGDFTILLNSGSGTLTVSKTFNGGSIDILAGDFNNDGKQDIVVSGNVNNMSGVQVFLGNGNGSFSDALAQNDERNAFVLAGDFNNDHKLDLLTYGVEADVQLGNGDGSFQPPIELPTGCNGINLASGDFNHDGKLDVAATVRNTPLGVAVCLGNGNGTFGNAVNYDQNIQHTLIAVGDFNNDSNLDLAVSDVGGISVLLGNGDGTFQAGIPTALANVTTLFVGDFNGDGKLDVVANTGSSSFSVLLGNGDGTFQTPMISSSPGDILAVGDLRNDGKLDLITGGSLAINVLLGNGNGTFQSPSSYTTIGSPDSAVLGDFNSDGKLDVAVGSGPMDVEVFFGSGTGALTSHVLAYDGGGSLYLAAGDFNGDHTLDIATMSSAARGEKLVVFLNPK